MAEIRILETEEQLIRSVQVFRQAMFGLPSAGPINSEWVSRLLQPNRVYGAYEGEELVGTANSFLGTLRLPGGEEVSHAAVTHVGVSPTHVRRGVVSGLLRQQLGDLQQQGVVLASLRASQGQVYQRFGYGIASASLSIEIDKTVGGLAFPATHSATIRLLDAAQAWPVLQQIYQRHPPERAGTLSRWPQWWAFQALRQGTAAGNFYVAVLGKEGEETAFVRYHAKAEENWLFSQTRTLVVDDLVAARPEDYRALLSFLLSLDVTQRVHFSSRALDDVLPLLANNPRALTLGPVRDETWLRIIDVQAALNARRYQPAEPVVVQINDPLIASNTQRLQLSETGAAPTQQPAELTLSITELSTLLLGGTKAWQLAHAARLDEHTEGAIARFDRLTETDTLPYSGIYF